MFDKIESQKKNLSQPLTLLTLIFAGKNNNKL